MDFNMCRILAGGFSVQKHPKRLFLKKCRHCQVVARPTLLK
jgi:hypothetical protein